MAIPSRIVSIEGETATVECFEQRRSVSLMLMPEPVEVGDYVLILANAYATEKVPAELALESLSYMGQILAGEETPLNG